MLERLAHITYRHRRLTVLAWVLVLIAAMAVGPSVAGDWSTQDRLPGADSQKAYDLLNDHMPSKNNESSMVVFDGVTEHRQLIDDYLQKSRGVDGVEHVGELTISKDTNIAMAEIVFDGTWEDDHEPAAKTLTNNADSLENAGVDTSFTGYMFQDAGEPNSEMIGIFAALAILLFAFGSVVAAGLPILVALFGVGVGGAIVGILAHVVQMGEVTQQIMMMICIGVGIDYTLLIVSRYRTALARLGDPEAAVADAMLHAGRAVLLAGSIVAVALMGLLTIGMATFTGIAIGCAAGVLVSVLAAVTFTPALLGFIGHNINRLHIGKRRTNGEHEKAARWAKIVQRRPKLFALTGIGALVVLALPLASLQLGTPDQGSAPKDSTNYIAYDAISRGFGPGFHGPILVVAERPDAESLNQLSSALRNSDGIVSVTEPVTSGDGAVAVMTAIPSTGPTEKETRKLLNNLRDDVIPSAVTNMDVHLGGNTAIDIDFAKLCADRLPIFIGAVLTLSFLMLMFTFRSVVIPLKAVLLNLLSLSAAGGLIVAVFQWGWGESLLNFSAGPVTPWIPEMLFAIVFGLSMDYEIFLLSAIREAREQGKDTPTAVFGGVGSTARVITAAAAIMAVVFGSFVGANELELKMVGLGLASAIIIDATIVRMLILPAVMTLLGEANWWLPAWLDRKLPKRELVGSHV